jgi:hypothetical protein
MQRRAFLSSAALAGVAAPLSAADSRRALFELRWFRMRTGRQTDRTRAFLEKHFAPAAQRAGVGGNGFFSVSIGPQSPSILCVLSYPSFEGMGAALDRLAADKAYAAGCEEYDSAPELNYIRVESVLLRAFETTPRLEAPPAAERPRVFELRTYESNNGAALRRKIKMFDDAEIAIFRRTGVLPIFFGETLVGPNLPNLTYMVGFDDLAQRQKAWQTFGGDPEWQKLRLQPGLTDPETVSNISNAILSPLAFSAIR